MLRQFSYFIIPYPLLPEPLFSDLLTEPLFSGSWSTVRQSTKDRGDVLSSYCICCVVYIEYVLFEQDDINHIE